METSYKGLVNLLFLLLMSYHVRMVLTDLNERGFALKQLIFEVWNDRQEFRPSDYTTIYFIMSLPFFSGFSYLIEKLAASGLAKGLVIDILLTLNLVANLVYPIVVIQWLNSHVIMSLWFLIFTTG